MTANPAGGIPDATVVAEVTGICSGLDRPDTKHRVWIHRDGSVTAPDHAHDAPTTAEQVAVALGDGTLDFCRYWLTAPAHARQTDSRNLPDDAVSWEMTVIGLWTENAVVTACTAVTGTPTHQPNDPVACLQYAQVFWSHGTGALPDDPPTSFGYLTSPWTRAGGWRRETSVTPAEVNGLLDAGIPVDRVAAAAALGFTPTIAAEAVKHARRLRLPEDICLYAAHAVHPTLVPALLNTYSTWQEAAALPARLAGLRERIREVSLTDEEVFAALTEVSV